MMHTSFLFLQFKATVEYLLRLCSGQILAFFFNFSPSQCKCKLLCTAKISKFTELPSPHGVGKLLAVFIQLSLVAFYEHFVSKI